MKKSSLISTLVFGILGIVIGVLFATLTDIILTVLFIVCGVLTLIAGIPQLVSAITGLVNKQKAAIFDLVTSVITIAVGIMLIFSKNEIIMLIVGIYLIVFPLIRTLLAKDKLEQLKSELLTMIIGVALVIIGPGAAINTVATVVGIIIAVLSLIYIIFGIITYIQAQKKSETVTGGRVFVDTDGDGGIDTVYVDTDGDGILDVKVTIEEKESESEEK